MLVQSQIADYNGFGRCLSLSNGDAEVLVTLDIGPRIIRYALSGGENFFLEDTACAIRESGPQFDAYYFKDAFWRIYGGHRIWFSPETMPGSYYPDNTPVNYSQKGSSFIFSPGPQKQNGVEYTLTVTMNDSGTAVAVKNEIQNISAQSKTFGIWSISAMCKNGMVVIPMCPKETGLLHNRVFSLWPYADMTDNRVYFGKRFISLRQNPSATRAFKVGLNNTEGLGLYYANGALFAKRAEFVEGGVYPDNGCNFETYTNPHFLELESLGVCEPVPAGKTITHTEHWQILSNIACPDRQDEDAFASAIEKFS